MPLSKEQLMIPSVLCIGPKDGEPNDTSRFWVTGQIIEFGINMPHVWFNGIKFTFEDFIKFPHLFKPLPWFEMRDKSDLPNYVKNIKNGRIYKAVWDCFKFKGKKEWSLILQQNGIPINPDGFEPADLSDYQEYQKQKEA